MTFEMSEDSCIVMTDCLTIERFLRRIGIVHPQVKIQFDVEVNGNLSTHIFGNENLDKFCSDGHTLLCGSTHYVRDFAYADDSRCCRLHPIAGKPFPLSIPDKLAEDGVCGVLEILSIAAICPCLKNYPNKPTRVSNLSIFIYGPSDLPILFKHSKNALSFFTDPSHLADWKQYEQYLTQNPDFKTVEGLACPDISYILRSTLEDVCSERGETQTLLLFLFIKYWDDFHLELVDMAGQQAIVDHLDQILHYNKDVVRKSIQPVLHQVLDDYLRFKKNQGRIQTATTVICDALQSILSMSTNRDFRAKSLQLLKVSSTQEMRASLQNTLQNVVQNRFLPSRVCYTKRVHSGDGDRVQSGTDSATPGASQENRCDTDQGQRIHAELSHSESDPLFTLVDSDGLDWSADPSQVTAETDSRFGSFERRIGTRKRQPEADGMKPGTNPDSSPFKKPVDGSYSQPRPENISTGHIASLKPDVQVPIPPRLTSETTDSVGAQCSPKQTINRKPTEDQEEYVWLREVSNLSDWTQ
ncbi:DUF4554 domain-containing protein [Scyliorhinus canicula]|uniref:DUF4554 domain-containing protein n=1 Tax=Scyliorhinus canicula TaxID=7830 RepID=UPI0018F2F204|nr:DUF4554 domain-containing protein [Scyliorhinus canicula]